MHAVRQSKTHLASKIFEIMKMIHFPVRHYYLVVSNILSDGRVSAELVNGFHRSLCET